MAAFGSLCALATPLPAQEAKLESPELRWQTLRPAFKADPAFVGDFGAFRSPLQFNDGRIVASPSDWKARRSELKAQWTESLGQWPPLMTDQRLEILDSSTRESFTQHTVRFEWLPGQPTTGYLLIPNPAPREPRPAVITVYYEPETAIGEGKPLRDFASQLAQRNLITLSIGTRETTEAKEYSLYWPNIERAELQPLSALACAAANAWHALANRPDVDAKRIGIVGHSYGGKWAMFASCLFENFACAAWSDPGIVFDDTRPSVNYWEPWYLGYHPKPWRTRGLVRPDNPAFGLYPRLREQGRNLHELHALMAPRPFLVSGGEEDPPRQWRALNHSLAVNRLLGFKNRIAMTNRPSHGPTEDSNEMLYRFFQHFLVDGALEPGK